MPASKPDMRTSFGETDFAKVDAHVITPEEYEEIPELTDAMVARAVPGNGEGIARRGRPPKADAKEAISIRLSPVVLEHFRSTGPGWQTRIDEALRRVVDAER